MLLDEFLPAYDFVERHEILVPGSPGQTYAALMRADLGRSRLVRALLFLRNVPARIGKDKKCVDGGARAPLTVSDLEARGFTPLAVSAPNELVFGAKGQFWKLSGGTRRSATTTFKEPVSSNEAVAVWNFTVAPTPGGSILATETRILCGDRARPKFRVYWLVIRPFSGLIRREILRAVRGEAATG